MRGVLSDWIISGFFSPPVMFVFHKSLIFCMHVVKNGINHPFSALCPFPFWGSRAESEHGTENGTDNSQKRLSRTDSSLTGLSHHSAITQDQMGVMSLLGTNGPWLPASFNTVLNGVSVVSDDNASSHINVVVFEIGTLHHDQCLYERQREETETLRQLTRGSLINRDGRKHFKNQLKLEKEMFFFWSAFVSRQPRQYALMQFNIFIQKW